MPPSKRSRLEASAQEQALICEQWKLIQSNMAIDKALHSFLTQKVDDCGQTIALEAFRLVQQVLNPKGFVRKCNKGPDSSLGAAIKAEESPWSQGGVKTHRQWDWMGSWHKYRSLWPKIDSKCNLKLEMVNDFCEPADKVEENMDTLPRNEAAVYKNGEEYDRTLSMPAVSASGKRFRMRDSMPDDLPEGVLRWETICGADEQLAKKINARRMEDSIKQELNDFARWVQRRAVSVAALPTRAARSQLGRDINTEIDVFKEEFEDDGNDVEFLDKANTYKRGLIAIARNHQVPLHADQEKPFADIDTEVEELLKRNRRLEPYWKFTMRSDDWAKGQQDDDEITDLPEAPMKPADIPDVSGTRIRKKYLESIFHRLGVKFPKKKKIAELKDILNSMRNGEEYDPDDSLNSTVAKYKHKVTHRYVGLLDRPDLIMEVGYFNETTGLFKKRVIVMEADGHDHTESDDDASKLALKLMSSSNAQIPVNEGETFHIRSNFFQYANRPIEQSLMQTTDINLPEFADIVREYQNTPKTRQDDYRNFHHAIHLMHHMFTAHVKIAFVIHMLVAHGIDMLSLDSERSRMRNYFFFVNLPAHNMPEELCFQDEIPVHRKEYLEQKRMLHSRAQVKYYDPTRGSAWTQAPLMHASTTGAHMRSWRASVWKGPLPPFPYEPQGPAIPVTCVRIQRVDMQGLIACVKTAAESALRRYKEAIRLDNRPTYSFYNNCTCTVFRRQLPDSFFLTRKQQYDRDGIWNDYRNGDSFLLRDRQSTPHDDKLEHNWGYEHPNITRRIDRPTPDGSEGNLMPVDIKWDQIDVRMHFFHQEMQKVEEVWKAHASGMWYLQDYIDFFQMIQSLSVPQEPIDGDALHFTHIARNLQREQKCALSFYAFQHTKIPLASRLRFNSFHSYYIDIPLVDINGQPHGMPKPTNASDAAHHRFSVLSYFFDCRDDGACRYEWENEMLEYFGTACTERKSTAFDRFHFRSQADWAHQSEHTSDCAYFNQLWFQMTFFLELNFRNAIAQLHYRLYDLKNTSVGAIESFSELQEKAKTLYNRQRTLLNTRARCPGPSNVTPGLSFWQKQNGGSNKNNVLKHLIMSQLNDELPGLDPYLMAYVARENIPDAQLFLRMIGCPNLIALRELAVQHRYLLGEESPPPGAPKRALLQSTLRHFPDGVQTEILYLLKKVQTDDSIFCVTPAVHPSKRVLLTLPWFTKMVRRILDVHARVPSFTTPLQMKFYMFTRRSEFAIFRQLFCTSDTLEHAHDSRPLAFILLQLSFALRIMKHKPVPEEPAVQEWCNEALTFMRSRDAFQPRGPGDVESCSTNVRYVFKVSDTSDTTQDVHCTLGTSLCTWPARDQNQINLRRRVNDGADNPRAVVFDLGLEPTPSPTCKDEVTLDRCQLSMKVAEQHKWILLMYARPTAGKVCEYIDVKHDDGLILRQPSEKPSVWQRHPDRHRDTMILGVRAIDGNRCELHDVPDADIFFEKVTPAADLVAHLPKHQQHFPDYILDIIPQIPDRTLIYVPAVFASKLRQERAPIHDTLFFHDDCYWRMSCVGYRAWAWKRLLVKCIFFDAWTKVMTRAMSLLALHTPLQPFYCKEDNLNGNQEVLSEFKDIFKTLKTMIAATKSALGDMQFKKEKLGPLNATNENKLRRKTFQVMLTVHKKTRKARRVDGADIDYMTSKVSYLRTQLLWVQHMRAHLDELKSKKSTRFLKVHARFWQLLKEDMGPETRASSLEANAVLIYGNYLHSTSMRTDMAVEFQNSIYVKFPREYAVLMDTSKTPRAGRCETTDTDFYFATLFDCRTYSVSHPKVLRKAYSQEDRQILQAWGNTVTLQGVGNTSKWHPAEEDRENVWAFIAKDISTLNPQTIDWHLPFAGNPRPFIEDDLLSAEERLNVYTMPDLYTADPDKVAACRAVHQDGSGCLVKEDFLQKVEDANAEDRLLLWNELRASTHYIETVPRDPTTKTGNQVLKGTECIENQKLKDMVEDIRTLILPKTNEDS